MLVVVAAVVSSVVETVHRYRMRKRQGVKKQVRGGLLALLRAPKTVPRRIALLTMTTLVLTVTADAALAVGALAHTPDLPLPEFANVMGWFTKQDPDWKNLPKQKSGTADGKPHEQGRPPQVKGGAGHKPKPGKGELPDYQRLAAKIAKGTSGANTGFVERTSKRVAAKSTTTSDYYENADGSYSRILSAGPVNYRDKSGSWKKIDTKLKAGADGRLTDTANSFDVNFAQTAADPELVRLGVDGYRIAYGLQGAAPVTPTVSGSVATYPEALPKTDLQLESTPTGMKESLVLKEADASNSWVFPLNAEGLKPVQESTGGIALQDGNGKTITRIPAAYAMDSKVNPKSGLPATTHKVAYQLAEQEGQQFLVMTLDQEWLRSPDRVFPVVVDPSTTLYSVSTYTISGDPPGDRSTERILPVGSYDAGPHSTRSFLNFSNADALDNSGVNVTSASLRIYAAFASTCTPQRFDVYLATQGWKPWEVTTWPGPSNNPTSIGNLTPSVPNACTNNGYNPDPTRVDQLNVPLTASAIDAWAKGTAPNYGLVLQAANNDTLHYKLFNSYNNWSTPPQLIVNYTGKLLPRIEQQSPGDGYEAVTLTPQFSATGRYDSAVTAANQKYHFQVLDSTGDEIADSGPITSPTWTVPAGKLAWNKSYYWTVQAYDGTNYSPNPSLYTFSTPVPQPAITSSLAQNAGAGFNPSIGNYTHQATDADVDTVGPDLAIIRDYNSRDPRRDGAFGTAWSTILDSKVVQQYDNAWNLISVNVTYPDGSVVGYGKNTNDTFTPPPGRFASLRFVPGGYSLTDKNGTVYTFTHTTDQNTWYLTSITDANGRALNFTRANGRVTKMTSAVSNRSLTLEWGTPSGAAHAHVTKVTTDPATPGNANTAQVWDYTYTGDQLHTVCQAGRCHTYGYNTGSPYHNQVLDLEASSYWPLAETSGTTAISAALANAHSDDGTYHNVTLGQPGPLVGSSATSASFNGTSSAVVLRPTYKIGTAAPQAISLWFKTGTPNGVLFSYQHDNPVNGATTPSDYTPALYVGSDGKLMGELWNNTDNTPMSSSSAVTDNQWHNVVLTSTGLQQWLFLDGVQIGSKSGLVQQPGQWTNVIGAGYLGGTWPNQPHYSTTDKTGYASFFNGLISNVSVFDRALTQPNITGLYAMAKQPASYLTSITLPSGKNHATVAYDAVTGTVTQVTDENGGNWTFDPPTVSGSSKVYRAAVLGSAPATYFRMNDTASATSAQNELNSGSAIYSNVTLGADGPFSDSRAVAFNGTSSFMELSGIDQLDTQPGSVEMWFKMPKDNTAGGVLYGQQANPLPGATQATGNHVPVLYVGTDGKLRGKLWDQNGTNGGSMVSAKPVNDGTWHHVVLTAGTANQAMYLDGTQQGTTTVPPSYGIANYTYIGAGMANSSWPFYPTNSLGWFPGSISDVAFFRSQLSPEDVNQHYAAAQQSKGMAPMQTVVFRDPGNNTLRNEYDLSNGGRQISATDALGHTTSFGYDSHGFERTVTDPNGNVQITGHDVRGNVVSKTTCQNLIENKCSTGYYTYLPDSTSTTLDPSPLNDLLRTERDARSSGPTDDTFLTVYDYDAAGNKTSVTTPPVPGFPGGRVTKTSYTDGTTIAAADGGYAPAGLPYKIVDPGGGTTLTGYYKNGDVASVTDAAGLVTRYTYDGLGRLLTKTEVSDTYPTGLTTTVSYDDAGNVDEVVDPPVTNRVTGAIHTAKTTTVYDLDDNPTSQTITDTTGGDAPRTISATYNSHNQIETQTDEVGNATTYAYDAFGNTTSETDPEGRVNLMQYNANGQVILRKLKDYTGDPNNPTAPHDVTLESRSYWDDGSLATITDAMGTTTEYSYYNNGLTWKTTKTGPNSEGPFVENELFYDGAGNAIKEVTNNGATTTTQSFDTAGRVYSATQDPGGAARTTTISYTPNDQIATSSERDAEGSPITTSFTYDPLGRKTSETLEGDDSGHPVGWWKFNQTSGRQVTDASGTGAVATASDNVTWEDSAASMNGAATTQIATNGPVVDTTQNFTVSGWIKPAALNGNSQTLVSQDGVQQSGFYLQYAGWNGKWTFQRMGTDTANSQNNVVVTGTTTPVANTWTHLAATYNAANGEMAIFVNGQKEGTATYTTPWSANGPLVMGRAKWNGGLTDFVNGSLDNVQAYNRVLSTAEVTKLFNGGRNGGTTASYTHSTTKWALDKRGLPTSMTDPNGNVTDYSHDEAGREVVATSPTVNAETTGGPATPVRPTTMVGYDTFGAVTENQDANGNITTTAYDAAGRKTSVKSPDYTAPGSSSPIEAEQTWEYNDVGEITKSTDPLGGITEFTYDQQDNVSSIKDAKNGVTTNAYDLRGEVLSTTSPTGAQTQATYDYLGRTSTSTILERHPTAVASTTTYSYTGTPGGAFLGSETTQGGAVIGYTYNNLGEVTRVTDPAGVVTKTTYDQRGRKNKIERADGTATRYSYDLLDQPVKVVETDTDGTTALRTTSAIYDGTGAKLSETDARNHTTTFTNDALGRITSQTEPVDATNGITVSFGYDAQGNRTRFTDGRNNSWTYGYNTWNQPETAIEPATSAYSTAADRTSTISYDANGRETKRTSPGGVVVDFEYDALGAITKQNGTGAETPTATRSFTYDGDGRMLTAKTDAIGTSVPVTNETFTYNDRGYLLTATGSAGPSSFAYNADGLMTQRTDGAGTTTYGYDNADRLKTIQDPASGATLTYGYDNVSRLQTISYGTNANTRTFGYDPLQRLTSDTLKNNAGTTIASISYGYDLNDNVTSKNTTGLTGASNNTYTYDFSDRLTGWTTGSTTTVYEYDASGNRVRIGADVYTYDARNQLTSDGTNTYTYTARGTLKTSTKAGTTVNYTSDAYGQQITQATLTGGTQTYLNDALGRNITATGPAGNSTFTYSGTGNTLASDGTSTYTRDPFGGLVGIATPGSNGNGVLALTDQHDDVVANFKATTGLTGSTTYDPLGIVKSTTGMAGRLGYQSDWTDAATGQVNMGARWYNPALGQFQNKDTLALNPVPNSIASNAFAYADANPLSKTDPDGHAAVGKGGKGGTVQTASQKTQLKKMAAAVAKEKQIAEAKIKLQTRTKTKTKKVSDAKKSAKKVTKNQGHGSAKAAVEGKSGARGSASKKSKLSFNMASTTDRNGAWSDSLKDLFDFCIAGKLKCSNAYDKWGEAVNKIVDDVVQITIDLLVGDFIACYEDPNILDCGFAALSLLPQAKLEKAAAKILEKGPKLDRFLEAVRKGAKKDKKPKGATGNEKTKAGCPVKRDSFVGSTQVLMSDGSAKRIDEIKAGDKIRASVPGNEKAETHVVAKVIVTESDRDFVDLEIATSKKGRAPPQTGELTTTYHHPFYSTTREAFVDAADLKAGDKLQQPDGTTATVLSVRLYHFTSTTYNLTVNGLHTYYVLAGNTPVLVHNDSCPVSGRSHGDLGELASFNRLRDAGYTNIIAEPQFMNHLGQNFRGDFIARAPDGRIVVVDAKTGRGSVVSFNQEVGYGDLMSNRGAIVNTSRLEKAFGIKSGQRVSFGVEFDLWTCPFCGSAP